MDQLRGAIVGFGEVAQHGHWPAYRTRSDVAIVAVVDRSAERRQLASSLCRGVSTFSSVDELLGSDVPTDFIDICTPPALHADPMLAAIRRGLHVICEKPLLLDPVLIEAVRERARDSGVVVIPVHNWKYAPIVRCATTALTAAAIGRLRRVEIETVRLRAAATAETGRPNWRRDPVIAGGGILMDHGWHAIYLALHWFNARATTVDASFHRPAAGEVEDETVMTIRFPNGEARIVLTWNGEARSNRIRLIGEGGEILVDDETLAIDGRRQERMRFDQALSGGSHHPDWFSAMIPDVVGWMRNPDSARPVFDEAAECLSIIQRAYQSDPLVLKS
jgi:predicted dehydrogenase